MSIRRARSLRRLQTDAEAALWRGLRSRQTGFKFRRQHPFEGYVLDFFCQELQLAVEIDGGQHFGAKVAARDRERTGRLEAAGLRVMRFTDTEVLNETESVLEAIWLAARGGDPSP